MKKLYRSTYEKKLLAENHKIYDGQIAIFIALIFQVLFIFFAMLVNIGLIVHDKINLQNAVDLAAYYGAERQAEILNEIAHVNYQMRQDYKLFAFRNWVLGAYGSGGNMPPSPGPLAGQSRRSPITTGPTIPADSDYRASGLSGGFLPAVCVDHNGWNENYQADTGKLTTYCARMSTIEGLPHFSVSLPLGFVTGFAAAFDKVNLQLAHQCNNAGPQNWYISALWHYAFRVSTMERKSIIRALAYVSSKSQTDFEDISGQSTSTGAQNTFIKNLTESNRIGSPQFSFLNGLAVNGCGSTGTDAPPGFLSEIEIEPRALYVDTITSGGDCSFMMKDIADLPVGSTAPGFTLTTGTLQLEQWVGGEPASGSSMHMMRGVEKNPWCLAYVGVKATTKPRKPFAPFGQAITLQARGFASPFGGRIGPWNGSTWSSPVAGSSSDPISPIDKVAVPRGANPVGASVVDEVYSGYVPNYSRYPGDTLGFFSLLSYQPYKTILEDSLKGPPGAPGYKLHWKSYILNLLNIGPNGDVLAYYSQTPVVPSGANPDDFRDLKLRGMEAAAVAPDLFDITYYSIDSNWYNNYFHPGHFQNITFQETDMKAMSDLGSSLQDSANASYHVTDQIIAAREYMNFQPPWLVSSFDHLLTGWAQGQTGSYVTNPPQFGRCDITATYDQLNNNMWPPVPGSCVAGGRVGYSVRLISKNYLEAPNLELGGKGVTEHLVNPPSKASSGGW